MNSSILNFTIVNSPKTKFSDAQVLLHEFTGKEFSRNDAETIWANIVNHKWNMSEKLHRDIGFKVAAIDFIENFYQPKMEIKQTKISTERKMKFSAFLQKVVRSYFESKAYPFYL